MNDPDYFPEGASEPLRESLLAPESPEGTEPPKSFHAARKIFILGVSVLPIIFLVLYLSEKMKKCCLCTSWSFADKLDLFNRLKVTKILDSKCTKGANDQFLGCVVDTISKNIASYQEFKQKQGIISLPLTGIDDNGFTNCANGWCRS